VRQPSGALFGVMVPGTNWKATQAAAHATVLEIHFAGVQFCQGIMARVL
jgi:hypothetical protein